MGDVITFEVKITRKGYAKGELGGFVHSKYYPFICIESWYIIIRNEVNKEVILFQKVSSREPEFKVTTRMPPLPKAIKGVPLEVLVINDSY